MKQIYESQLVSDVVSMDYRTASVFSKAGIDFCCNGERSIARACAEANRNTAELMASLQQVLQSNEPPETGFTDWPAGLLADYIEQKHHRFVRESFVIIESYLQKILNVHGYRHPELHEVKLLFEQAKHELEEHMKKEELVLFPYIREMQGKAAEGMQSASSDPYSVQTPIAAMRDDHNTEGERFRKIATLTNNYSLPPDGCNTYAVTLQLLKAFEEDLHLHIHLENNILFNKALELERNASQ